MSEKIDKYTIMISAPSDVYTFVEAVKSGILKYNIEKGMDNGIIFAQKNWREHVFPDYGNTAQDTINNQITNKADLIIALFGAKFGEQTEKYPSGTLEEIETVHKNGGKVMTYFYTMADIKDFDEQFEKVQEYKKAYNGIYSEFKDEEELIDKVYTHLQQSIFSLQDKNTNDIKLCSYANGEIDKNIIFEKHTFVKSDMMRKFRNDINILIDKINKTELPNIDENKNKSEIFTSKKKNQIRNINCENIIVREKHPYFHADFKNLVSDYVKKYNIFLTEDFYYTGKAMLPHYAGGTWEESNEYAEKEKLKLLRELEELILQYSYLEKFLQQYEHTSYLNLVLCNNSSIFLEDIVVNLEIEKNVMDNPHFFQLYGLKEKFKEWKNLLKFAMKFPEKLEIKNNAEIEDIEYGVADNSKLDNKDSEYGYYQEYYYRKNKELYPFILTEKSDKVVIKFNIKGGLRQFSSKFLCAPLFLNKEIDELKYCITARNLNKEIKGILKK